MASALNTKINSYAIENGIEFDFAVATPPTQTGTLQENTPAYWSVLGLSPVYESTVGPPGGSGSWRFTTSTGSGCRLRNNGGVVLTLSSDGDYSIGFWAKANSLRPTSTAADAAVLYVLSPTATTGFAVNVTGGNHATPNKISLTSLGSIVVTDVTMDLNTWYYFAVTKTGTNLNFYINNQLKQTRTAMQNATSSVQAWGDNVATVDVLSTNISNWYYASTSVIGPTQIAEIWTAGSGINKNIQETPATATTLIVEPAISTTVSKNVTATPITATALIQEPTIVIVANNSVQITTSIVASATLPSNVVVTAVKNKNNVITEVLTASAIIGDNVIVSTGSNESYSSEPLTATALLIEPFVAISVMTASATMPGGTASVTPNYYSLVKALNPVFYYNFDTSTIQNFGSWTIGSPTVGSTVEKNVTSTGDLSLIGAGKSWKFSGNYYNAPNEVEIPVSRNQGYVPKTYNPYAPPLGREPIIDLVRSRSYAIEYWFKPASGPSGIGFVFKNIDIRFDNGTVGFEIDATLPGWNDVAGGVPGPSYERYFAGAPLVANDWNHVVLNAIPGDSTNDQIIQFWVNGNLYSNISYTLDYTILSTENVRSDNSVLPQEIYIFNTSNPVLKASITSNLASPQPYTAPFNRGFWNGFENSAAPNSMFDEVAIYEEPLTNSQIIDHYSFIYNQSPDRNILATPLTANIDSENHAVIAIDNAIITETPATATTLLADPSVLAVKNKSISADIMTASALNTDVTVYYGRTMSATPAIAYAEKSEAYFLNDFYSNYVQANIAPYRYVTFDSPNAGLDYGSDNDYSVVPTTIGGIIVNPDLGINGKSAKTVGTSYITDGVILNESEWNDSWGTGANSYHSAFWFQRALDDASTTGLRVLWNLNGYKDSQHAVLYQYQGKLHMQVNNGSGTLVEQDTTALDLFDYQRHFIVIEHTHGGGGNNTIKLYVDAILKFTFNFNSVTLTTTNAASADSGPNDETNNRPRLSIGCLITPFGSTALPVAPANTKLIIDEVYWDKNSITQTQVTNLYNAMPAKTNKTVVVEPLIASDELVMPAISRSSVLATAPLTASGSLVQPGITANRELITTANVMTATGMLPQPRRFEDKTIISDVFVATTIFNNPGVIISIPGGPMLASTTLVNRPNPFILPTGDYGISVSTNGVVYELRELSPYIKYLRIVARNQKIYKDMEIL